MRIANINDNRKGAAALEFAVVAPFLFLIFLGMIEVGRALMFQHVLTTAAREGAREAILPGATTQSVNDRVMEFVQASPLRYVDVANIDVPTAPDSALPGDLIPVSISVPFDGISSFAASWFASDFELSGQATMRKEGFR